MRICRHARPHDRRVTSGDICRSIFSFTRSLRYLYRVHARMDMRHPRGSPLLQYRAVRTELIPEKNYHRYTPRKILHPKTRSSHPYQPPSRYPHHQVHTLRSSDLTHLYRQDRRPDSQVYRCIGAPVYPDTSYDITRRIPCRIYRYDLLSI